MRFDPWNPEFVAHPYDVYDELRRRPVGFFAPTGQWLIARHADVNALLRDRRVGRSYLHVATHADPARLDVGRADNPHVSFGAGVHFCLGAPLARIEPAESFGALLRRAPGMELVAEPAWSPGYVIRGLTALEVRID